MSGVDPFTDLDAYVRLPRLAGLWLSPDGRRLVVGVGTPDKKNARYATALWQVDPAGEQPARRLTRSVKGESAAAFTGEGDLLFTSSRPSPDDTDDDEDAKAALWLLPAGGGEPRVIAKLPGGVHGVRVSPDGTVIAGSAVLPSGDDSVREQRKKAGISAVLHEGYPVRYWDHDLGPDRPRLFTGSLPEPELRDVTGHAGRALDTEGDWEITPDGRSAVAAWIVSEAGGSERSTIVVIDLATGERREIAGDDSHDYNSPRVSPDGSRVAFLVRRNSSPDDPGDVWLAVAPVKGGPVEPVTAAWDRWPHEPRWTPDGTALIVAADDNGRSPLWRVEVASGEVSRLTSDDAAYTDLRVAPDGRWVYALRNTIASAPHPVRVAIPTGEIELLPSPCAPTFVPGKLEEVTAQAADGSPLRAWLALPSDADGPAPLVLWIHGGPLGSYNVWSWRWNPWHLVARGYAVLMPDPALSTGYGLDFIKRGWGNWGDKPYTDLMTITDAALERPDLDATRTAAMGGSFGGYMANWVAGHTDRFDAIVTHASLWALDQMMSTTDMAFYWLRELTPDRLEANSPHRFADAITTPMLVIHGDKDYRVPIGEALRLWWDLLSRSEGKHKFLYFPDENHWVLKPGNAKVWYETVFAFLDHHVLGKEWRRPESLG
ncbi:prolyl oligopeptidase family serine peptidase [Actinoplanes sp. Pm04-4]|uniref:Prolyl oligopeptidase family serine peptidase n=1 Tax=Paractinoplanes pyxinae TaxID=2997416 RepID=A0ABT4BE02_9ACTN|nr:prolyl oligopeptidase family serine peptidase [Actinoplanes pyxinae]MCY1144222.1 prolyl oligopeptidase family serine peptidase [Actinoplanes pyxinae]